MVCNFSEFLFLEFLFYDIISINDNIINNWWNMKLMMGIGHFSSVENYYVHNLKDFIFNRHIYSLATWPNSLRHIHSIAEVKKKKKKHYQLLHRYKIQIYFSFLVKKIEITIINIIILYF